MPGPGVMLGYLRLRSGPALIFCEKTWACEPQAWPFTSYLCSLDHVRLHVSLSNMIRYL